MKYLLFYISIFVVIYIYFGYPIVAYFLAILKKKYPQKSKYEPFVSILIAAYNEEADIETTIKNKLELNYPKSKFEIIVVSDGSDDATDEIIQKFDNSVVKYVRQEPRQGKTAALNFAFEKAKGDILVFSDANSIYDSDVLIKLIQNFSDPDIGYVTGKMVYVNDQGNLIGDGCSAYMKYENLLRDYETRAGSIVGVDGGVDAIRKKLYKKMNADQQPDFFLPLNVITNGYRVVYEPEAILKEQVLSDAADEYRMRVRVSLRALWILKDMVHLFNIFKFGLFSLQLVSHKLLRYFTFFFLIAIFISNILLFSESAYFGLFLLIQILFYLIALVAHFLNKKFKIWKLLYIPYYFLLINLAAAHAAIKFFMGKKQVIWNPRKGS